MGFPMETLFSLHIGRFSYHFLWVFVRKTHVALGFPRGKPCFPCILDGFRVVFLRFSLGKRTLPWVLVRKNCFLYMFRAILYVFVRKTYATLVVVAVVVAVGAVVVILIVLVKLLFLLILLLLLFLLLLLL